MKTPGAGPGSTSAGNLPQELVTRVDEWLSGDPDPDTRAELLELLRRGDEASLRERFDHPLSFGTAGIRGPLGAGPGRFNRAVVRRATAGLASYLTGPASTSSSGAGSLPAAWVRVGEGLAAHSGPVVVGHDARHGSQQFAEDAARVLAAAGLQALHFESALPTPILAFAVRHFGAAAGVMVTASHNPAPDNGYKVYLADGAQIFPPHDARVAAAAEKATLPTGKALSGQPGGRLVVVDEAEVLAAYRRAVGALLGPSGPRRLRSVYSPLHGVGGAVLPGLMEEAGFEPPQPVDAQANPDPDFPTTPFPNPEEPGVMDLALARAESAKADVVLVNDPDADRLAVAVPATGGGFRVLTGDELGVLIAAHLLARSSGSDRLVAATVVSSTMLRDMAHQAGVEYVETLTGFKWLARAARLRPGHRLLFAYEEALGYAASEAVADKDGMSAALVVAEMAALAKEEGRSLLERLDGLEADLGVHSSAQWSWRLEGSAAGGVIRGLMARWRSSPPERLGSCAVASVRDLANGEAELPPSDVLVLELANGGRVVLRPSGTEPKLKVYFEATTGPCDQGGLVEARRWARRQLGELRSAVVALVTSYQGALS